MSKEGMPLEFLRSGRTAEVGIAILGDVVLDRYLTGSTSRVSREAPLPEETVNWLEKLLDDETVQAVILSDCGLGFCTPRLSSGAIEVIQRGERPCPVKRNKQPVPSLGVETDTFSLFMFCCSFRLYGALAESLL